jgi:capsular polysaccharide biosynthesis protein
MELWEYFEVLIRWAWVIVLVTALCTAGALGLGKLQTPRYTSSVEIVVTPARLDLGLSQTVVNLLNNYVSSIRSEAMASRVIQRLGLTGIDAQTLSSHVQADANQAEYKITAEVTEHDPALAQREAQAIAELFAEDVQAFSNRLDPLDRLTAAIQNGGAQGAGLSWPRKKLLLFAGVAGGLMLGLLIALFLEWARVELAQTPEEVETWLGVPVLGSIPAVERHARSRGRTRR